VLPTWSWTHTRRPRRPGARHARDGDLTASRPRWRPTRGRAVNARRQFVAASLAGLAAFSVFGVFSSLVPRFLADTMGNTSLAVAGAVAFTVFASGRWPKWRSVRSSRHTAARGAPLLLTGLATLVTECGLPTWPYHGGDHCDGSRYRVDISRAMATAGDSAPPESRAETLAGFFLAATSVCRFRWYPRLCLEIRVPRVLMLLFAVVVALAIVASVRLIVNELQHAKRGRPDDRTRCHCPAVR